jgi:iron complex transport system ATP-binding protein
LLQAADVGFAYGDSPVLRGVGLDVSHGDVVGILGPNGSGKTTLLRVLAGMLKPQAGRVLLDGRDVASVPRHLLARRLAVVPQEVHLAFDYTVLEIALMGRYPHLGAFELEGPSDVDIAREALDATGMLSFEHRAFETLSGGEKQRVVIASALAQLAAATTSRNEPDRSAPNGTLLLLDEPTAALDLHYQIEVSGLVRRLNAERRMTIVLTTHDLNFAASVCHDLVLLRDGRVLASGPVERVLDGAAVEALYGVRADVQRHTGSGRLVVVPLGRPEGLPYRSTRSLTPEAETDER